MGDQYYPEQHWEKKHHENGGDLKILGIPIVGFGGESRECENDWTVGVASAYGTGSEHYEQKHGKGGGSLRVLGIPIIGVGGGHQDEDLEVTTSLPPGYVIPAPPYPVYEQFAPPAPQPVPAPDWDQAPAAQPVIPQGDTHPPCPAPNPAATGIDTPTADKCDAPPHLEARQLQAIQHEGPSGRVIISDVLKHDPKTGNDERASVLQFESGERIESREDGLHVFGKDGVEIRLKPTKKDGLYVAVKADGSVDVEGHKNRIRLHVDKATNSMSIEYSNGTRISADATGFTSAVETRQLG
jgi:hypothetical protein